MVGAVRLQPETRLAAVLGGRRAGDHRQGNAFPFQPLFAVGTGDDFSTPLGAGVSTTVPTRFAPMEPIVKSARGLPLVAPTLKSRIRVFAAG